MKDCESEDRVGGDAGYADQDEVEQDDQERERFSHARTLSERRRSAADCRVHEVLGQRGPNGFDPTDAPMRMSRGTTLLVATGTFARRDVYGTKLPARQA